MVAEPANEAQAPGVARTLGLAFVLEDDARHIRLASTDIYDVIISEPSHPWVAGVANLFMRDFYALAARRIEPDGVFAQWLQTYNLSGDAYRAVLAAFQSEFRGARDMAVGVEAAALVDSHGPALGALAETLLVDRAVLDESPLRRAALVDALERIGRDPSPWKAAPPR